MRITVLRRGGLSVYGASHDARQNKVILDGEEQRSVTIEYPSPITAVSVTDNSMTHTTPVVSGTRATTTISGPGRLTLVATMGSDRPTVTIEAETRSISDYGSSI